MAVTVLDIIDSCPDRLRGPASAFSTLPGRAVPGT
jgi:hypothetical protein